jgi:hypothetical protein
MSLRVDRASFLTLTFGMAGLACNTGAPPVVANVVDIPRQPPQPADAGAPAVAARAADPDATERDAAALGEATDDDEDEDGDMGSSVVEGGGSARVLAASSAQSCGWVDPKSVARPAAACRDDQGTVGSCSVMKSCPGFAFPKQKCEAYRRLLKPKVAQKALDCLAKLAGTHACDACKAYRCGDVALKSACPDPSADTACAQITSKCGAVSMSECRMYLSGLNAAGRAKMTSCLTAKSGCGFGIYSCSESLF